MIDIGNMAGSLTIVDPEMTAEVSVQASNLGADQPFGPVVVSAISRSGSANYHGDAYFNARNNVLNANGWQQKHAAQALGPQHYYYPGGSFGGPVPGTHKKLLFWGGYEKWLQNQGNAERSAVVHPHTGDDAGRLLNRQHRQHDAVPAGILPGQASGRLSRRLMVQRSWRNGAGERNYNGHAADAGCDRHVHVRNASTYTTDAGQKFPAGFLDPGAAALAKIWPKANRQSGEHPAADTTTTSRS